MTQTRNPAARRSNGARIGRKALMMSCASAALAAAALYPQSARAQAFQGNITSSTGSVSRVTPTSTTETITVGTNTATINWSPTNQQGAGTIDFLPNGNVATFTSAPGILDYTVLNRIIPTDTTRGISLNGHIISTLQGTSATGGRIWFYSPGGILIGSTAIVDVGSLLLTTNDLVATEGPVAMFSGPAGSTSKIQIQNGAQINALQSGSYVALIAPRIEQGGKVRVNGSAAYVAGEQVTMTINQGLFDIQVDVGTTDPNGIVHTGETSGPANTVAGDNHSIYMVAVPKNQALQMLLGGKVGFDDAASAQVQNGQIILSAGYGTIGSNFANASWGGAIGGTPADMRISGGTFTSSTKAAATGNIDASGGGGALIFTGDVSLQGLQSARLTAHDGETVTIGGNLTLSSDDLRYFLGSGEQQVDAQAGYAALLAESGGSITIAGSAAVTANASPTVNVTTNYGGTSRGGTATVDSDGGPISIGGNLTVSATAFGDGVSSPGIDGRDSWGGNANIFATGSSLHIGGNLSIVADGDGSSSALASGGTGGTGHGGDIEMSADDGGAIAIDGTTNASASGIGGTLLTSTDGTGGEGDGGNITVASIFGASITFNGNADFLANGIGQSAALNGGDGFGGGDGASLLIDGGTITANGDLRIFADGFGGNGLVAGDGYGGFVTAGISAVEGQALGGTLNVAGDFRLQAGGHGGNGSDNIGAAGGQGGDGYGGSAFFFVSPDQDPESTVAVHLADVFVAANGEGGSGGNGVTGGNGGSGFSGGDANIEIWAGDATAHDVQVFSTARGGNGGTGSGGAGGNGGDANGGISDLTVGGNLTANTAFSYDRAFAGNGGAGTTQGNGGQAQGGSASIDVVDGGDLTGNVDMATTAFGGAGNIGGNSSGGFDSLIIQGALTAGTVVMDATATGGAGVVQGGNADGGFASFDVLGGSAHMASTTLLHVDAFGGNASNGSGGSAIGGSANAESLNNGSLTGGDLTASANATGGNGTTAGLAGGGDVELISDSFGSDGLTSIALDHILLTANGTVGSGGVGGGEIFGYGGTIDVSGIGGSVSAQALSAQANGTDLGGSIHLGTDVEFNGSKGNLAFGTTDGIANGGNIGGFIFVTSGSGTIIDLGNATLTANGTLSGEIFLSAGTGCECGGGGGIGQSALLPAGGGIAANNLTLNTSGSILMTLSGGADISVANMLQGNALGLISMIDDGTGGAIRAHVVDLSGLTIIDSADIIADEIDFRASSDMTLGNLIAANRIDLSAGGNLFTGNLTAGDKIGLDANGDIHFGNLTADRTDFSAGGSVTGGDIHVTTRASGNADGPIVLGNITAGPNVPAGNDFSVGMSSLSSITVGNVTGAGHVGFATLGDLTTGNLTAGDLVMLLVKGNITTGSITTQPTGRVYLADSSMFILGGGTSGGDGSEFDPNIVLAATPVRTGGSITINGPVNTGRMQAAAGGDLTAGDITAPNGLTLDSGGSILAGNLTGQTVALNAGGNTTVHDVHASGSATFTAGLLATFGGIVNSPTIAVTSSDIDILEGASLGVTGVTNLITLNAISHGLPIILGGDNNSEGGAGGQYHLGNEDGDIRTAALVINAVGAAPGLNPDVNVFDAQIEGSTTSGGGIGSVTVNTPGSIDVLGDVHFINAGATDSLTLNAGHNIEVNTDTGSIVITDSAGHLAGTLDLHANNVFIGSGSLLGQLEADANFVGRDAALGANSGTPNQDGFVRAGTITGEVGNSFLVQNSGTPDLFAGIDTGPGGLSVTGTGATPATLIIYGRQTQANGTTITNQDFLGTVTLNGAGGFTPNSSVNGCTIGENCGHPALATPGIDMASILGPLDQTTSPSDEDKKKDKDQSDESDDGSSVDPSLRLINTTPVNLDHQIDEPVTSGGDVVVTPN